MLTSALTRMPGANVSGPIVKPAGDVTTRKSSVLKPISDNTGTSDASTSVNWRIRSVIFSVRCADFSPKPSAPGASKSMIEPSAVSVNASSPLPIVNRPSRPMSTTPADTPIARPNASILSPRMPNGSFQFSISTSSVSAGLPLNVSVPSPRSSTVSA
ncbi:hypothetical protein Y043_6352 [Burkholderia pseudomallei MSHR2138]|nr:hypothetical protein Y043_6352 [Burkholderia pseudomallei MSHR2138]